MALPIRPSGQPQPLEFTLQVELRGTLRELMDMIEVTEGLDALTYHLDVERRSKDLRAPGTLTVSVSDDREPATGLASLATVVETAYTTGLARRRS